MGEGVRIWKQTSPVSMHGERRSDARYTSDPKWSAKDTWVVRREYGKIGEGAMLRVESATNREQTVANTFNSNILKAK